MNVYKPRYKVAYQTQSKIWPYKDSRLRRFFNIRGRKLVRQGFFKRIVLVFNNMKWTIARRYIRPYMRRRKAVRRRFRNAFYNKQQLRAYFGQIQEEKFRNFFKKYVTTGTLRNNSFFTVLERRLDVFFFRTRLLPTIFACHQYILHQGVLINDGKEHSPSTLIRPGDILTIPVAHWHAFHFYLLERIKYRCHGKYRWLKRKYMKLKKKSWALRSILRGNFLMFYLWQKRRALDTFLIARKKEFLLILTKLINQYAKIKKISENSFGFLSCRQLFLSFKKFIFLEKIRRKFFYLQWLKFKVKVIKKMRKIFPRKKKAQVDIKSPVDNKIFSAVTINIREQEKTQKKYSILKKNKIQHKIQTKKYNLATKKIILNKNINVKTVFSKDLNTKKTSLEFKKILNNKQFRGIVLRLAVDKIQNFKYKKEVKIVVAYLVYVLFLYFPNLMKHISYNKRVNKRLLATLLKMDIWFLKILKKTGNIQYKKWFFNAFNDQLLNIYKTKWDRYLNHQIFKKYIPLKNFPYLKKIVKHEYFDAEMYRLTPGQTLNLSANKKINKNQYLKKSKQIYKHFIYFLKTISSTYLHWLSLMLQLRFKELDFYYFFSGVKNVNFIEIKNIIQQRKTFFILQTIYIRTNIILYYKLLLRKFFRLETRKSYHKTVPLSTTEASLSTKKKLPKGNQLTYFLIRRLSKTRRKKKIPRLKQVHWAIPQYVHFDVSTLTTVLLYFPKTNEIHYSFRTYRCSLTKIISFYKSLGL